MARITGPIGESESPFESIISKSARICQSRAAMEAPPRGF